MGLEAPEALGGLLHGGARPAQGHRRGAPVFHVAADAPHRAHDVLDDVRAGQGPPQFGPDGEHLIEPFQDRGGNALPVFFETPGEIAKQLFGFAGVVDLPGLAKDAPHLRVHRLGQRSMMLRAL